MKDRSLRPNRNHKTRSSQSQPRKHLAQPDISLAKLTPPSLPRLVERPHIIKQIDQIRDRGTKVLWIQAAPGAGKTTLAASYALTTKGPVLWYQLNGGDADPATWIHYLTVGIQAVASRFRKPMLALEPAYMADLPGFTRLFFEQLFGRLKSPGLLIFDNYHDLPSESPVQSLMVEAFRTVPPGTWCMVTSRQAPPPVLASLIADQSLVEFPAEALSFDLPETQRLLALHHTKEVSGSLDWARQLHAHTQGWIAGVILLGAKQPSAAFNSSTSQAVPLEVRESGDHSVLIDYFVQEALTRLTPDVRMLLLKTAVFPSFSTRMAHQLTGLSQAGYELNKLSRARYFVESRDGIFQYHPLFQQFLNQQAHTELGTPVWQSLQAQAAHLLEEEGWVEEAIQLFLESGSTADLSRLLIEQAPSLIEQGRFQTLFEWIARLSVEDCDREPYLLYWKGMSQVVHSPTESLQCFEMVFSTFHTRGDIKGMLLAASGAIYSIDFTWAEFDRLDKWQSIIQDLWDKSADGLPVHVQSTVIIAMMRSLFWRQPHRRIVQAWLKRAEAFIQHYDRVSELTIIVHHILCCARSFGSIHEAVHAIYPVNTQLDQLTLSVPNQVAWEISQTGTSWVMGEFGKAKIHFQRGLNSIHEVPVFQGPLIFNGLYAALHGQDLEQAETIVSNENFTRQYMGPAFYAIGTFQRGWFHALTGNMKEALVCAQESIVLAQQSKAQHFEAVAILGVATVLAAEDRFDEMEKPLSEVETIANEIEHVSLSYSCHILRAYVLLKTCSPSDTIPVLTKAFTLGRQHDMFFTYESWLPSILAPLCAQALEEGIEPDYVQQLIQAKQLTLDATTAASLNWPWPVRIQTLGPFRITTEAGPVTFGRKAPLMPLRLLKLLISLGGQNIPLTRLADNLWPDAEGDAAYRSILTNLARLRKLLGREDALRVQGGVLSLNTHLCWVDSLVYEHLVNTAVAASRAGDKEDAQILATQATKLYSAPFLSEEDTLVEVMITRARLADHHARLSAVPD